MIPPLIALFMLWAFLLTAIGWWVAALVHAERRSDRASLARSDHRRAAWDRLHERSRTFNP